MDVHENPPFRKRVPIAIRISRGLVAKRIERLDLERPRPKPTKHNDG